MRTTPWLLGSLTLLFCPACGTSDPGNTNNGTAGTASSAGGSNGNDTGGSTSVGNAGNGNPTGGANSGGTTSNGSGGANSAGAGTGSTAAGGNGMVDADGGAVAPTDGDYLPWAEGNTWTYRVTDTATGMSSEKATTVDALEAVGGSGPNSAVMANHVITTKMDGTDKTESWQAVVGEQVLRYREQAFSASTGMLSSETHWDPPKLRLDESAAHTMAGATWSEQYDETVLPVGMAPATTSEQDQWTVVATDQMVTVPAGTFSTLVLTKFGGSQTKTYYYARGVGKVKEEGTITEELVSYDVAP